MRIQQVGGWLWWIAEVVAVCCLPVFLITASVRLVTFSPQLYEYGFRAYDIPSVTGLPMDQLLHVAEQTRAYFESDQERLAIQVEKNGQPLTLYNEREVQHMADVKALFGLVTVGADLTGSYLLALLGLGLWVRKQAFVREALGVAIQGSLLTIGLVLLLGLMTLLDFDRFFLAFHFISFTNTLWQLDPSRDYLIMMYPGGFFRDAALAIAAIAVAEAGALLALALFLLPRARVWPAE